MNSEETLQLRRKDARLRLDLLSLNEADAVLRADPSECCFFRGAKMIQLSDHFTYKKLLRYTLPSVIMLVFTSIYGCCRRLLCVEFCGQNTVYRGELHHAVFDDPRFPGLYVWNRRRCTDCQNTWRGRSGKSEQNLFSDRLCLRGRRPRAGRVGYSVYPPFCGSARRRRPASYGQRHLWPYHSAGDPGVHSAV